MKKFRKARILAALICALMFVQTLGLGGLRISASAANASVFFEDDFDYDSFADMKATGLWDIETVQKTDSLEPVLDNGVLKLREKSSVQFKWTKVNGIGNFSANNTYTFEFDFKITDLGNGSVWGTASEHTRALYGAMGGWYNLIEVHNKNGKIRQGDSYVDYNTADVLNKTLHATVAWSNTVITTTITKQNGDILISGSRSNGSFADMNAANKAMTYLVLRCEDGAAELYNFKFSCQNTAEINSQITTYTADVTHAVNGKTVLKMDGKEIFSLNGSTLRLCNARVEGSYAAGDYSVKVVANPLQKIMYVELTLADGGTVRRGVPCYTKPNSFSWESKNGDAVSNKKTEYTTATARDYTLVTVEPTVQGFGSEVYNLVSSFDDPATTRLLAWTAKPAFVDGADMAVKYRVKGESAWQELTARRMSEKSVVSAEDFYKAEITGLSAGTEYEYKIGIKNTDDSAKWSKTYTFKTAEASIDSFKFVAIGDTQSLSWGGQTSGDKGYTYTQAALDLAIKDAGNAAFILNAGDITDDGDNLNMWNWYFKALSDYGATVPHFAAIGNHDTWSSDSNNYFSLHLNHPDNGANALDQSFSANVSNGYVKGQFNMYEDTIYSYNYGDAHFIVLNSGAYYNDDRWLLESQRQWLIDDLEANEDAKWKILMVHEPVYHRKGGNEDRPWLYDVIEGYGVDLVIQGHSHLVTRTYPMLNGQIVTKESPDLIKQGTGTVYTTIGSTTLNHDSIGDPTVEACLTVITPDNEQAAYTVVSVEDDKLVMTVKQLNGYVLDEFTILADDGGSNSGAGSNNSTASGTPNASTDPSTDAPADEKNYTIIIIGGAVALCAIVGVGAAVIIKKKKRK